MKHILLLLFLAGCSSQKEIQYAPNNYLVKVDSLNKYKQFNLQEGVRAYKPENKKYSAISFAGYDIVNNKVFSAIYSHKELRISIWNEVNDQEDVVINESGYKFIGSNQGYDYGPLITYSENVLNYVLG